jgi:hypothetical protein
MILTFMSGSFLKVIYQNQAYTRVPRGCHCTGGDLVLASPQTAHLTESGKSGKEKGNSLRSHTGGNRTTALFGRDYSLKQGRQLLNDPLHPALHWPLLHSRQYGSDVQQQYFTTISGPSDTA